MTAIITTAFLIGVAICLIIDLELFNRKPHAPTVREAAGWSAVWVALSAVVGSTFWSIQGAAAGTEWFTAYVMEKALSVDNLFVFSMVFTYFNIPAKYQHKVLVWGIIGAVALRLVMISAGVGLVSTFHWLLYIFGAFLIYAGAKMLFQNDGEPDDVEKSLAVRIAKWLIPYRSTPVVSRFFVKEIERIEVSEGHRTISRPRTYATRLFLCLIAIEISDVIFAVDSIPVVVSITQDFLIAFTSNVMAILGLRSLFFLLQHLLDRLRYLPLALGAILVFIGMKMLVADYLHISPGQSLAVVTALLLTATLASLFNKKGA